MVDLERCGYWRGGRGHCVLGLVARCRTRRSNWHRSRWNEGTREVWTTGIKTPLFQEPFSK